MVAFTCLLMALTLLYSNGLIRILYGQHTEGTHIFIRHMNKKIKKDVLKERLSRMSDEEVFYP